MAKYGRRRRVRKARKMRKYTKRSGKGRSRYRKMRKYRTPKTEKKYWTTWNDGDRTVGQLNIVLGNSGSGHDAVEVTPKPPQGTAANGQRVGDVVNLAGVSMRFQFQQQSTTSGPVKAKIYVLRYKPGYAGDMTQNVSGFLDANAFVLGMNPTANPIYDYRSVRNQTAYPAFEVMAYKKIYIPPDNIGGQTMLKDVQFVWKKNHTIRFQPGTQTIQTGQIFTLVVADSGNKGNQLGSYVGVSTNTATTGLIYRYQHRFYYTDA